MHWSDEGIVINTKRYGENRLIASVLTLNHGRHLGLLRQNPKINYAFQPGCLVSVRWNARLEEHLGHWTHDTIYSPLAEVLNDSLLLAALSSACALIEISLPERQSHRDIYQSFKQFIYALSTPLWPDAYIFLEHTLLANAGIKLDFHQCAVTGSTDNLIYLSPRSGRAVSRDIGAPYHDKLLTLPSFLTQSFDQSATRPSEDILKALEMMENFLERFILNVHHLKMPEARHRFKDKLKRQQPMVKSV